MKYLITLLILRFGEVLFIEELEGNTQIFTWNVLLLSQPILLSLALNQYAYDKKAKISNFVVLIVSFIMLSNFIAEWVFYDKFEEVRLIFSVLIFLVVVPLGFNAICRSFTPQSAEYDPKKSYVVMKRPGNFSGLIAALVTSPYGHCSLVTKGKHFKFTNGIIRERRYAHRKDVCLVEIRSVPLSEARKLLHTKWSLFNNCYTIFNKYKRTYAL